MPPHWADCSCGWASIDLSLGVPATSPYPRGPTMPTTTKARATRRDQGIEYADVLIVGAGISGIGTASHLASRLPDTSFLLVEARQNIGGTWDLFRYPGLRADTDAQNFGFASKPWRGEKALADGS